MKAVNVLFVCLGNICRSPTAEGVFQYLVNQGQLEEDIHVDSAGTGDWHIGRPPDHRSQQAARQRGYVLEHLRARQVTANDFNHFQYILAMDRKNLAYLEAMRPDWYCGRLELLLNYGRDSTQIDVPDPFYGGENGFAQVLDLIESAATGLLEEIILRDLVNSR